MQNYDNTNSDCKEDISNIPEAESTNPSNDKGSYIPPHAEKLRQQALENQEPKEKPTINKSEEDDYQSYEYCSPYNNDIDVVYSKKIYRLAVDYDFYQSALGYLKELTNTGMNYIFFGFDNYMKNHNRTKYMVADIKDDLIETLSECSEKEINYAPFSDKQKMDLIIMKREQELERLKTERDQLNELERER